MNSVFAYSQTPRDDGDSTGFTVHDGQEYWIWANNEWNGYDYDTEVDCLENYDVCKNGPNGDWVKYWPYPSPYPYWMCPHTHIAEQSNWSSAEAEYAVDPDAYETAWTDLYQNYYLNSWVALPNGYWYPEGYVKVSNLGGGNGAITADMMEFHYNPNNRNDSTCS